LVFSALTNDLLFSKNLEKKLKKEAKKEAKKKKTRS